MSSLGSEIIPILIIMTTFILIMVIFIIIFLFFLQKKQHGYDSKLKAAKIGFEQELYKTQLEIQEQTFQQIAREIHDNVGQFLSLAKLGLATLDIDSREEAESGIAEITEILGKALEDLRDMSKSMNPDIIRNSGLKRAIEIQAGFLKRGGRYQVDFDLSGEYRPMPEQKEIILFRILQEAINNIIRHAKATNIAIRLNTGADKVQLHIADNGQGFDLKQTSGGQAKIGGLINMQQRARMINASFEIESFPEKGTTITVSTPF